MKIYSVLWRKALFAAVVCFLLLLPASAYGADFRFLDVPVRSWYHDAVYYCAEENMMTGTAERIFAPEEVVTRGMFVTILGRCESIQPDLYKSTGFTDTMIEKWYGPYVAWAAKEGIVSGYGDGTFCPEQVMTREELMQMLYQYGKYRKLELTADTAILERFSDCDDIGSWAVKAVAWCMAHSYVNGFTNDTLAPKSTATRGQIAKIMTVWKSGKAYTFHYGPTPGERTLKNLLNTALEPVGSTLYVYGGGWNEADDGAGVDACTIGLNPQWKKYFLAQDKNYDYTKHRYELGNGLDCSGYIGWTLYNVMESESGRPGYVMSSTQMAKVFSEKGWGRYTEAAKIKDYRPGDIMSTKGHVYMALGQCDDGSVVLLHSSPNGVMISGTTTLSGNKNSEGIRLANEYMKKYFPVWYARYPDSSRNAAYLTQYDQMRWDLSGNAVLTDKEGFVEMTPREVLEALLGY